MKKAISLLFMILSVAMYSLDTSKTPSSPPALVLSYTSTNPTCPGLNNGAINGTVTGGNLPYSNFSLSNGTTTLTSSTGVFSNLAPGTYTLSISDAFSTVTQPNIILIAPTDLSTNLPRTICAGTPTTLSVSGTTSGVLWTANPPDASLTAANNTNTSPVVRPNQTTTYTVTSTGNSPSANMVTNGDFTQGNLGFTSDYLFIANAGTSGVQRAYGVVTTANAWFQFFPSCNIEHTSGTGKMMVVDGSTSNAGADKVWGQTITVQPNQTYTFSYWVQTVAMPNPANIEVKINGVVIGTNLAPSAECNWALRTYTWNSGTATSAQIAMYDKVVASGGNDFALDDISFTTNVICNLSKSVVITVTPSITPTFNSVNPICVGAVLSPLPTTSNNSITGTWSPALNNVATTTYTFTPSVGQCATNGSSIISIIPNVTPTFSQVPAICSGAALAALPTTSNNSVTGSWSPAINNSATTGYTFTPSTGQCATTALMTITVTPFPQFTITKGCDGSNFVLSAVGIGTLNASYIWYNNLHQNIGTTPSIRITAEGNYSLELSNNGCSEEKPVSVTNIQCTIPKGISPNGDGNNDIFDLSNLNVQKLQIFNRYGIEVYSKSNYTNEWTGKSSSGAELPDGTYYFVVQYTNGKTKTGWVYINK